MNSKRETSNKRSWMDPMKLGHLMKEIQKVNFATTIKTRHSDLHSNSEMASNSDFYLIII